MNKDDLELISIVNNKEVHFPIMLNQFVIPLLECFEKSSKDFLDSILRTYDQWKLFYPSAKNKVLQSFPIGKTWYAVETERMGMLTDATLKFYTRKIEKELKQILSGKEKYYYKKLNKSDNTKLIETILRDEISKDNSDMNTQFEFIVLRVKNNDYAIVGKNKPQLARTAVYINSKV